jgi:undecaprenyl-diphosphatase
LDLVGSVAVGLVQGLTEFIPVSSSGHLVLLSRFVKLNVPPITLAVSVHIGTLVAVAAVYYPRLLSMLLGVASRREDRRGREGRRLLFVLFIGSIPAGVAGLAVRQVFERAFSSLPVVGAMLILTGILLLLGAIVPHLRGSGSGRNTGMGLGDVTVRQALTIGLFQALAIFPGLSRSGATISAGLLTGLTPAAAADFSFLLSIPAIIGASGVDLLRTGGAALLSPTLAAAAAIAAVSGYVAVRFVLGAVRARRLALFVPYCWLVGLLVIYLSLTQG